MDKQVVFVGFPSGTKAMAFLTAMEDDRSHDMAALGAFRWAPMRRNQKEICIEGPMLPAVWKQIMAIIVTSGGTLRFQEPARSHCKVAAPHAHGEVHRCAACDQQFSAASPPVSGICIVPVHAG
jgi:hypothetical protein